MFRAANAVLEGVTTFVSPSLTQVTKTLTLVAAVRPIVLGTVLITPSWMPETASRTKRTFLTSIVVRVMC